MTGELSMSVFSPWLWSLFSNITLNLLLIMSAFKSWVCFHFHRHLVTLFGYDTAQFRQCGIFIHNIEHCSCSSYWDEKKNICWRNPSAVKVSKIFFLYFGPIQGHSCKIFLNNSVFEQYFFLSIRDLQELCVYLLQVSEILKWLAYFIDDMFKKTKKHWCK